MILVEKSLIQYFIEVIMVVLEQKRIGLVSFRSILYLVSLEIKSC